MEGAFCPGVKFEFCTFKVPAGGKTNPCSSSAAAVKGIACFYDTGIFQGEGVGGDSQRDCGKDCGNLLEVPCSV